jgi:hypothetical protein
MKKSVQSNMETDTPTIQPVEEEKLLNKKRKADAPLSNEKEKKAKIDEPVEVVSNNIYIPPPKREEMKEIKEKITGEKKLNRTNESLGLLIGSQGKSVTSNDLKPKKSNMSKNKDYNSESLESSSSDSGL